MRSSRSMIRAVRRVAAPTSSGRLSNSIRLLSSQASAPVPSGKGSSAFGNILLLGVLGGAGFGGYYVYDTMIQQPQLETLGTVPESFKVAAAVSNNAPVVPVSESSTNEGEKEKEKEEEVIVVASAESNVVAPVVEVAEEKAGNGVDSEAVFQELESLVASKLAEKEAELAAQYEKKVAELSNRFVEVEKGYKKQSLQRSEELLEMRTRVAALDTVLEDQNDHHRYLAWMNELSLTLLNLRSVLGCDESARKELQHLHKLSFIPQAAYIRLVLSRVPSTCWSEGVPSQQELENRLNGVLKTARRATLVPEGSGLGGHLIAWTMSWFLLPEKPLQLGEATKLSSSANPADIDAVLSSAQQRMAAGHLEEAVALIKGLRGLPARVCADWLKAAELRLTVLQAVDALQSFSLLLSASVSVDE